MPYCSDCGREVEPDDVYCQHCGSRLGSDRSRDPDDRSHGERGHGASDRPEGPDGAYRGHGGGGPERRDRDPERRGRGRRIPPGPDAGRTDGRTAGGDRRGHQGPGPERPRRVEDGKLNYALVFPASGGYGPIGGGAICSFLSFLFVPAFTLYGYAFRLTGAAADGTTVQPRFSDDLVGMTVKGFLYFLFYLLVLVGGTVAVALLGGALAVAASPEVAAVFGGVIGLLVVYLAPAVLTLYPATGSAAAALSPRRVADFAFTGRYFVSFLGFILLVIGLTIGFFLVAIGLIITVIGIFVLFPLIYVYSAYVLYVTGAYWGATYYQAVQDGLVDDPETSRDESGYDAEPY